VIFTLSAVMRLERIAFDPLVFQGVIRDINRKKSSLGDFFNILLIQPPGQNQRDRQKEGG
jgi:hypothetical protein